MRKVWKRIDAWRGYYTYEPSPQEKKEGWRKIAECHFVPHGQNNDFIRVTKKALNKYFRVRVRSGETSNVFSRNVVVLAKPKNGWTPKLKAYAKKFEDAFVEYYTSGFSIFSGETYPIDLKGYEQSIELKAKSKLKEVI